MEEPTARALRHPPDRHRLLPGQLQRDLAGLLARPEVLGLVQVSERLHVEEEAVEVHGVAPRRRVDHPPPNRVALHVAHPLGVRPGSAVDGQDLVFQGGILEDAHDHHLVDGLRHLRALHSEGARREDLRGANELQGSVRRHHFAAEPGEVVEGALRVRDEPARLRRTRGNEPGLEGCGAPLPEPVHHQCRIESVLNRHLDGLAELGMEVGGRDRRILAHLGEGGQG